MGIIRTCRTCALAAALLLVAATSATAQAAERCDNCMMKVADSSAYRVALSFRDGSVKVMCSLYCASMEAERHGDAVTGMSVRDYVTGETLDAADAVWVVGSDAKAMMSEVSRIAFKDKEAAEAFMKEHGGSAVDFQTAYAGSVSEWKGR